NTFLHAEQAEAAACRSRIESESIIFDNHDDLVFTRPQRYANVFGLGMPGTIRKGLLHDPINASALRIGEIINRTVNMYGCGNSGMPGKFTALPLKCRFNSKIVEHGRPQAHSQVAKCAHGVRVEPFGFFDTAAKCFDAEAAQTFQATEFHA